jgi:hypothetical protein
MTASISAFTGDGAGTNMYARKSSRDCASPSEPSVIASMSAVSCSSVTVASQ